MQMTIDQAMRPGLLLAFARRGSGYMMRSEKRSGSYGGGRSGGRPPRRRKRAGFLYIFLTLLISIILWPVGMVMLWRRKVRLQAGTKLLISLLTLCLSVFLIVFALTVPVDNPEFTAFQDRANDWLDQAAVDVAATGDAAYKKGVETWQIMSDFTEAASDYTLVNSADAIDDGVALAGRAREAVEGLLHREGGEPEPGQTPAASESPEATETPEVTGTPEATATPEPTEEPPVSDAEGMRLHLPESVPSPEDAQVLAAGALHADGTFTANTPEPTEAPTEEPTDEPTEAPTEEPTEVPTEEPAEEPAAIAAAEATPEAEEEATEEPTEEPTEAPTEEPTEEPVEEPAEEPVEEPAEEPVEEPAEKSAEEPVEEPIEEPAEEPAEEPVEEPAPEATPDESASSALAEALTLGPLEIKPAGEATVYYFENGSQGFHRSSTRHDMKNAPAHTLAEAFEAKKKPCNSCGMPDESILSVEHIAWVDEGNVIHTTDECASFSGDWRLMSLEDAVNAGCTACPDCRADRYVESIFPAPTPTPAPMVMTPAVPLKDAGEFTVYFYEGSKGYHIAADCVGMTGAPAHTLAEAVEAGKSACGNCNPPSSELVGLPVLWLDDSGLCHTSDACADFNGGVRLIPRDDALEQGLSACPSCGAEDYLVPGTVIAEN